MELEKKVLQIRGCTSACIRGIENLEKGAIPQFPDWNAKQKRRKGGKMFLPKNEATAVGRSSALANNATGFFRRPKECGVADVADEETKKVP